MSWDRELELYRTRVNGSPADEADACTCEYPGDVCPWCERELARGEEGLDDDVA